MSMKHRLSTPSLLLMAATLLLPATSQAHGTWLASIHGEPTVLYGHDGADTDPYMPTKIENVRAFKNGKSVPARIVRHENRYATLDVERPGVVGYTFNNGYWHKDKDGKWQNKSRQEAADPAGIDTAVYSVKYSVNYLNDREPARALGYDLEIVPSGNPSRLDHGEKLTVQLLYKGKPLPGVEVDNDFFGDGETAVTDADGRVTLPVARDGLNTFAVEYQVPHNDRSKADKTSMFSGLSFHAHEDHHHEH